MRIAAFFPCLKLDHTPLGKRHVALLAAEVDTVKKIKRINKVVLFLQLTRENEVAHFNLTSVYIHKHHAESRSEDVLCEAYCALAHIEKLRVSRSQVRHQRTGDQSTTSDPEAPLVVRA